MPSYRVEWVIEIEADSAFAAAKKALEIQRDHDSTADHFTVIEEDASEAEEIDVTEDTCPLCGEYNNDGEGYDGLCGSCADDPRKVQEYQKHNH